MKPSDCIRAAIPDADDALIDHIVWGRTAYPFAKLEARDFYQAASRFRRASERGIRLCDFCDRIAVENWCCQPCLDGLKACNSHSHMDAMLEAKS